MGDYSENTQATPRERMKLSSIDVDPIETIEVFRNPTELGFGFTVNWQRMQVPGLPHEPKHYINTSNPVIPLELFYNASRPGEIDDIMDKERFFEALAYPIEGGGMPRVLVQWPRTLAMIMSVNSVQVDMIEFARNMRPKVLRARIELEEITDGPGRTYQEIRQFGWARAGSFSARTPFIRGDIV